MEISVFIREYAPLAGEAGRAFRIDPVVILAQAAIETGWGESTLCREYHNFFGITAYGLPNVWWTGRWTELSPRSLRFRIYPDDKCSFMDYCRLLRSAYPRAADMSANPTAFAKEIAYSPYISEVNGDNREAYRKLIVQLCRKISSQLSIVNPKGGQMPPSVASRRSSGSSSRSIPLFPKRQTLPALLLLLLALLSLLMRETEVTLAAIGASLTLFRHDGTPPPHRPPGRTGWVSPATPSS